MIHISNKIIVLNSPSDDDVAALMLNFQMFYFPSRFEGWGLAPSIYLALTNKKPYVSATRVNLEVLGDSAFMIDNWADLVPLLA
jgi:glycosyltransferase involved in cell wall biosynthesis